MGDNVKVIVRCRPLNSKEKSGGYKEAVQCDEINGRVLIERPNDPPKTFTFDHVFGKDSRQVDVYNLTSRPIVDFVCEGYNGTIFAYGQTGTGKTFTMEGVRSNPELKGIIPNSFAHIFSHISKLGDSEHTFLIRVSYLEIYNEEIRDLLGKDPKKRLEIKERPDVGIYVKDKKEFAVSSAEHMEKIMSQGNQNRHVGATLMNADSSRSHAIFTITIESMDKGPDGQQRVRKGQLHMVDLAGSERQAKTGATGDRLKEATKINLSLSTLGNVISALVDGKSSFIPYRNSKLTRLLQDSLGGNSKTLMIATFGPANYNFEETISTLRYANRAKNIKNSAVINEDPKDALLREMQEELDQLKKQLEKVGESGGVPTDQLAEMSMDILKQRENLEKDRELAEKDKLKAMNSLKKKEAEIKKTENEQAELEAKMAQINQKVVHGGVNLLEKDEEQQKLLEDSNKELQQKITSQEAMKKRIVEADVTLEDINKKYSSLQEEASEKTRKLKKIWSMFNAAKSELADIESENAREIESMLDNIRELEQSLQLKQLIIRRLIPPEMQQLIEENMSWNDMIGEWQVKGIAYTGNNMMKRRETPPPEPEEYDEEQAYLVYGDPLIPSARPKTSRKSRKKTKKSSRNYELEQL